MANDNLITQFILDLKPISVNSMYMTRGRFRVKTTEARDYSDYVVELVTKALTEIQKERLNQAEALKVVITIESTNWFTKTGKIRKKDVESYAKCTNDAVFSALDVDDSMIFELVLKKKTSDKESVTYQIFETTFDAFQ